ncbi:MAG TPA: antibiotic biosynthesis monooxygenase family protein [Pyrinomonadaceae bacterium]|jgi:heme-degrading monooxygenase HmoA
MIARMIFVKVAPDQIREAIEDWKKVCAPLMISQPGCLSEELLECNEHPDEFISLSHWESMDAIKAYRSSEAHEQIKHGTRGIKADVSVKTYKVMG